MQLINTIKHITTTSKVCLLIHWGKFMECREKPSPVSSLVPLSGQRTVAIPGQSTWWRVPLLAHHSTPPLVGYTNATSFVTRRKAYGPAISGSLWGAAKPHFFYCFDFFCFRFSICRQSNSYRDLFHKGWCFYCFLTIWIIH